MRRVRALVVAGGDQTGMRPMQLGPDKAPLTKRTLSRVPVPVLERAWRAATLRSLPERGVVIALAESKQRRKVTFLRYFAPLSHYNCNYTLTHEKV